ncbi:hypothetical protein KM043_018302 [Ampulex compressa]|nr:hypothetical protein KM043_018302 [Ampulex compressa]
MRNSALMFQCARIFGDEGESSTTNGVAFPPAPSSAAYCHHRRRVCDRDIKWYRACKLSHSGVEASSRRSRKSPRLYGSTEGTKPDPFILDTPSPRISLNVRSIKMLTIRRAVFLAVIMVVLAEWSSALPADKERLLNEVDLVDDDGSIETALINYLFTKQIVKRLRNQLDIADLQRKRSYWKQCAFNAVSCFGK